MWAGQTPPTPSIRASLESLSKWKKQIDKGYGESAVPAKPSQKPMLAHKYDEYKHKISWDNAWAQPKLDGIRCLAKCENGKVTLHSRGNKPITTMGHIVEQLEESIRRDGYPQYPTLDGELYVHGERFQDIVSWVKRKQYNSLKVEYHIYDVISSESFADRFFRYVFEEDKSSPNLKQVALVPVYSESDLQEFHDESVKALYEGAILRWGDCLYKEGYRSQSLLKFKAFFDDEFKIIGARQGDKGRSEGMAIFQMKTKDGGVFDCMPEGTREERCDYWNKKEEYIGKSMTVRFFGWTTSSPPIPRFPIGIGIRQFD